MARPPVTYRDRLEHRRERQRVSPAIVIMLTCIILNAALEIYFFGIMPR